MTNCTCPSGDGSLRWPCPVHPPTSQSKIDEILRALDHARGLINQDNPEPPYYTYDYVSRAMQFTREIRDELADLKAAALQSRPQNIPEIIPTPTSTLPSGAAQFRKKPVTISAIRWTGDNLREVIAFTGKHPGWDKWFSSWEDYERHVQQDGQQFKIFTLEGTMRADIGDWIIRGVKGEHYPCKPDIFEATYETSPAAAPVSAEPVAVVTGMDEFGPLLGWHKHWVNFRVGTKFYTAPVAALPDITQQTLDDVKAGIPARDAEIVALRKKIETLQAAQSQHPVSAADRLPIELRGISKAINNGGGLWRSCSGCHETNEGMATGTFSETLKCILGVGCSECGGIGAIWDTTDYDAMGDFIAAKYQQDVAIDAARKEQK